MAKLKVPKAVQQWARFALYLIHNKKLLGGTMTGWRRARQLASGSITPHTANKMRIWFSRHGPGAANGGTSYQSGQSLQRMYQDLRTKQLKTDRMNRSRHRAFVSWALWGGDDGFLWIQKMFPSLKGQLKRHGWLNKFRNTILKTSFPRLRGGTSSSSSAIDKALNVKDRKNLLKLKAADSSNVQTVVVSHLKTISTTPPINRETKSFYAFLITECLEVDMLKAEYATITKIIDLIL